jgi:hypothetical protein
VASLPEPLPNPGRGPVTAGTIAQATIAAVRPDFGIFFAIAAPFTLFIDMILSLYGPEPPRNAAELTPRVLLLLVVLPGIIGAIAQMAVAYLVARPDQPPRHALAAALAAMPVYIGALLLASLPTGLGLLLLIVPGIYVSARLFVIVPIAVVERLGPIANLRRSWAMTQPVAWTILWFIVLAVLFVLGLSVLASGVGAAVGSLLKLMGVPGAARFVVALVPALASTLVSIASAAAATTLYLRLR